MIEKVSLYFGCMIIIFGGFKSMIFLGELLDFVEGIEFSFTMIFLFS